MVIDQEARQGHPWLKLDAVGGHDPPWYLGTPLAVCRCSSEVSA
jgi:hypothetical protein